MFNKKFSLILVTLVFMLSLSVVSASDNSTSDDLVAGDVEEEPPSVGVEEISTDDDDVSAAQNQYLLSSNDINMYYKNGTSYEVVLSQGGSPISDATVLIKVNGITYRKTTDENGVASLPIGLGAGSYPITASYGDVKVESVLNVLPVIKASDVKFTYGYAGKYTATFLNDNGKPLANKNVKFKINGVVYTKKTDSKGVASMDIGLKPGTYEIYAIHPNGYRVSNKVVVQTSISASDFTKYYGGSSKYSAKFYNKNGKVLANKQVKFTAKGKTFTVTTNSNGVAYLGVISQPSNFKITSINPNTGEKVTKTIKVLSTISASDITHFSGETTQFKVTLRDKETGKVIPNKNIKITANGVTYTKKTNSNGVATLNVGFTAKGTYKIVSKDPNTGYAITNYDRVKLPTLKASSMTVREDITSTFKVTLTDQNKKAVANSNVEITINGVTKTVKTDKNGVASINFKLNKGTYTFTSKDPSSGYKLNTKITVLDECYAYSQYGVSADGKTILAIGRPSASGELSQYGYKFYITEFVRECPCCHSTELYWGIFWAGDETTDVGVFPVTGYKEGGSAEGHIFCANCDADWSVFGHNHGSNKDLTVVSASTLSSKDMAYLLKSGNYVK